MKPKTFKSTVLFALPFQTSADCPRAYTLVPVGIGFVPVRAETSKEEMGDALEKSKPRAGETILNSIDVEL